MAKSDPNQDTEIREVSETVDPIVVKRKNLPDKPGIYIYKDRTGKIIYIGKAKSLTKRVSQYFQAKNFANTHDEILYGEKLKRLVTSVVDMDFIVTETEKEALILENDMIKKNQPRFNVLLKDDKSFPFIMITYAEKFPRILIVRGPEKMEEFNKRDTKTNRDASETHNKFYGPYIDARPMRDTLKQLRKYFPYCSCNKPCKQNARPCINYQIGLCPGPCSGKISREDYLENIRNIDMILNGNIEQIIPEIQNKMKKASADLNFELAAKLRDAIDALKGDMTSKQAIVNYEEEKINRDIIGYYKTVNKVGILIMHVRDGKLVGKTPYIIDSDEKVGRDEDILASFFERYYMGTERSIPDDIILPSEFLKQSELQSDAEKKPSKPPKYLKDVKKLIEEEKLEQESKEPLINLSIDSTRSVELQQDELPDGESQEDLEANAKMITRIQDRLSALLTYLEDSYHKKVAIRGPGTGKYTRALLSIASKNVQLMIKLEDEYKDMLTEVESLSDIGMSKESVQNMSKDEREAFMGLKEVKDIFSLPDIPRIIEGFDISNLQQGDATGALVTFVDGRPNKAYYRSFIIKRTDKEGDYAMMQEVIERHYSRIVREQGILPDLIVVDGGKAQVHAAYDILSKFNLTIPVIGLEKKKTHTEIDRAVIQNSEDPKKLSEIPLKQYTPGYNLLQKVSQEYHRRAIQHHQKRLERRTLGSPLDNIDGIGEKTRQQLMDNFGTLEKLKTASVEDFKALLGEKRGQKIFESINKYFAELKKTEED